MRLFTSFISIYFLLFFLFFLLYEHRAANAATAQCPALPASFSSGGPAQAIRVDLGECVGAGVGSGSSVRFGIDNRLYVAIPRVIDVGGVITNDDFVNIYGNDGPSPHQDAIINASSSCASGTEINIHNNNTNSVTIEVLGTRTCSLELTTQILGSNISYTGEIIRNGNAYSLSEATVSGLITPSAPTVNLKQNNDLVRTHTKRIISNLMNRRADQITANDPELVTRLQNRGTEGESGQPVGFTADGTLTNNKLAFSTSLRQMMVAKEKEKSELRNGLGDMMSLGQQSLTNNIDPNGWDLWVKGTWAQTDSDRVSNDLGLLHLGVDYRFSPSLLIGFLTQFDWTDEKDSVDNFKVEGQGWMTGPYMVARLHENLLFDGRAAWGQSTNDVSPFETYADQFDTTRWLLKGQLTGDFKAANWHFAPHVAVLYFEEEQDAYTDSLNVYIPGQTISLGRLTFGPKVSTSIETSDGTIISPHLSLKGIWDFDKAEVVDLNTGLAAGASEDLRARVEGGLSVRMINGWSLNGEGFYDGIGVDDLKAYGGSVKLTVPLN